MAMQVGIIFEPFIRVIKALLLPLSFAILFSYFLHPLVEGLHKSGLPRIVSVLLVFVTLLLAIGALIFFGAPALIEQVQHAMAILPEQVSALEQVMLDVQGRIRTLPPQIQVHIDEWTAQANKLGAKVLDQTESVALWIIQSIFSLMVIPFLVFYFLKDYNLIEKVAWYITPRKWRHGLKQYVIDVDHTFGSFIRGQLLVSLAVAILSSLALWLIGVPYPFLLGLFIGATDMIPYFGSFIGAVPAVTVALLESWQLALFVVVAIIIVQQIEGNVLSPVIVGRTLHLHPILIILALLIGVELGGVIGLLIAVPTLAIVKVTLVHIRLYFINH